MAGGTRSELANESPDSSVIGSAYSNGQRGSYSGGSLDKSGSFRDGGELSPLSQFVALEPVTMGDLKFTRAGELRRVLGVSIGSSTEDHSFGATHSKIPPPITSEEVKRFKASVLDTSNKARDRAKKMTESIQNLDKYLHIIVPRKRKTESSERSGLMSMLKMGSQTQRSPPDLVSQRLEDKNKNIALNRRVRTSVTESEGRNAVLSKQPVLMAKDIDILKTGNGCSIQIEEKMSGLPAAGEGWDKRMKRKRSIGAAVTKVMDGDREPKRAMHMKNSNDPRSGPSVGITGINKSYGTSHIPASNSRSTLGNELESDSFPNDRRDRASGFDKERVLSRGNNKLNVREDDKISSPIPMIKGKATRAPRTGSSLTNSSPSFSRAPGALDCLEQTPASNIVKSLGGGTNQKRPIPAGSSSPPMAQWVGQRPQKISRTRRANLVSSVSTRDNAQIICEGFSAQDVGARLSSSETNGSLGVRAKSNNTQQLKIKFDPYSAKLSESEESGACVENKLKEKGLVTEYTVDRAQKIASFILPTQKSKSLSTEDIGDDVTRQGRSGRGSSLPKAYAPPMKEKLENPATSKLLQATKLNSDNNESKSGRPPLKKLSDRKASSRPGKVLNPSGSFDMTCESDDDHDEILAAANSASNSRYLACSGSFWKKMEPVFSSVCLEDIIYLKQQLNFVGELDENLRHMFSADDSVLGDQNMELPSSQQHVSRERRGLQLNGVQSKDPVLNMDSSSGNLDTESRFGTIPPLYQRVLSALIGEEEFEEIDHDCERRDGSFHYASDYSFSGTNNHTDVDEGYNMVESESGFEVNFSNRKHYSLDSLSSVGSTASNSFRISSVHDHLPNEEMWQEDDSLIYSEVGITSGFGQSNLDRLQSLHTGFGTSFECQYDQMCLEDRLLLELQSIGLYPDTVPDLIAEGEEEHINTEIVALNKALYQQVVKRKLMLYKIEKVSQNGRDVELRDLEHDAMNKLAEMAYKKGLASRGSKASKNGVSKVSKQAALAFAKRTIARCQEFENTGRSCFNKPALRDAIFGATPGINGTECVENMMAAASTSVEAHNSQPQSVAPEDKMISSNRLKKRELMLDDVTTSRSSSALGNTLMGGGPKGRRSERDRDQNKCMPRNSAPKAVRPILGERKAKPKPKQKTAQLSTSRNGILGRTTAETVHTTEYSSLRASNGSSKLSIGSSKLSKDTVLPPPGKEDPTDLTNLQLQELDSIDVSQNLGGSHDLSWLDFDEDGLQDHDSMGLEIPMDDLSDLNMLM
ncbi:hypothetical protein GIB67_029528 [Kingdonia uniflora]|uniref:Uncharacterized protein n=1 Tax=Kingdonia uniflora TaxID=39325 RepID=A0A7J7NYD8_9MAGN|nr:hypothetical protein GIB67_029528 [Kingdonia uniflora]